MAVGDVVSDALQRRGADVRQQMHAGAERIRSAPAFSCRIPAALQAEVRADACRYGITVTAVVAAAVESFLSTEGGGLNVRSIPHLHQKGDDEVQDLFVIMDLDAA